MRKGIEIKINKEMIHWMLLWMVWSRNIRVKREKL